MSNFVLEVPPQQAEPTSHFTKVHALNSTNGAHMRSGFDDISCHMPVQFALVQFETSATRSTTPSHRLLWQGGS